VTTLTQDAEQPTQALLTSPPPSDRSARLMLLASVGLLLVAAGVVLKTPELLLLGLTTTLTSVVGRRVGLDIAAPAAALCLLLVAIVTGQAAGLIGVDLLGLPWLLATFYLLMAASAVGLSMRPVVGRATLPRRHALRAVAFLPAWFAVVTGIIQFSAAGVAKSWAFWGTDLARHMTTISLLQQDGRLDYRTSSYPRGLHMLAALVSVPGAPVGEPQKLLVYDLKLEASLTWFALAIFLTTAASFVLLASSKLDLAPAVGTIAALLVGCGALITNTFVLSFVYPGAAPSLAAMAVLVGIPLAATAWSTCHRVTRLIVICSIATLALAHLWQAVAVAPVIAAVLLLAPAFLGLRGLRHDREVMRALAWSTGCAVVCAILAAPPLLLVAQAGGLSLAATPGNLAGGPWRILVPGLLAVVAFSVHRAARSLGLLFLAMSVGLAASVSLLLRGSDHPFDLNQYYPEKACWFLTAFLAPLLALGAAAGLVWTWRIARRLSDRAGRHSLAVRTLVVGIALGPLAAAWLGYLVGVEASTVTTWRPAVSSSQRQASTTQLSAVRYDDAIRLARSNGHRVVVPWVLGEASFDLYGSRTISALLTFQTGQREILGGAEICREIAWAAGSRRAVVASQLPPNQVRTAMAAGGCAGRAPIIQLPNTGYRD
jgi:hypothetical protein